MPPKSTPFCVFTRLFSIKNNYAHAHGKFCWQVALQSPCKPTQFLQPFLQGFVWRNKKVCERLLGVVFASATALCGAFAWGVDTACRAKDVAQLDLPTAVPCGSMAQATFCMGHQRFCCKLLIVPCAEKWVLGNKKKPSAKLGFCANSSPTPWSTRGNFPTK